MYLSLPAHNDPLYNLPLSLPVSALRWPSLPAPDGTLQSPLVSALRLPSLPAPDGTLESPLASPPPCLTIFLKNTIFLICLSSQPRRHTRISPRLSHRLYSAVAFPPNLDSTLHSLLASPPPCPAVAFPPSPDGTLQSPLTSPRLCPAVANLSLPEAQFSPALQSGAAS